MIDPVELVVLFLNLNQENDYNDFIWSYVNEYVNLTELVVEDIDLIELYITDLLTRTYDELRAIGIYYPISISNARKLDKNSIIITFI